MEELFQVEAENSKTGSRDSSRLYGRTMAARVASATALALSTGSCMAFVAPTAQDSSVGHLRAGHGASAPSAPRSSSSAIGGIAGLTAVATVGLAVSRRSAKAGTARRGTVGVCLPLTDKFDPLNLSSTDAKMDRYTQVEIKHGRVAMIATMGYIMPELFRFPGCESFQHGLGAFESIPVEGWVQLVALVGAHEVLVKPREGGLGPSDFGLGTELLDGIDDEELERKQTSERNNGRLAMIAIMGLMVQEMGTGDGMFGEPPLTYMSKNGWWGEPVQFFVQHINNCQSFDGSLIQNGSICALPSRIGRTQLRAVQKLSEGPYVETETYPKEMEMSAAVPFLRYPQVLKGWVGEEKGFDPLGVTDALPVYWELKHGRICMLATVGWIATDLGFRFPGDKFQSVSNAFEAHDKMVEAGYMLPFLGAIGTFELYSLWLLFKGWEKEVNRDAGDFFLGKQFLPKEPEKEKDMRLKAIVTGAGKWSPGHVRFQWHCHTGRHHGQDLAFHVGLDLVVNLAVHKDVPEISQRVATEATSSHDTQTEPMMESLEEQSQSGACDPTNEPEPSQPARWERRVLELLAEESPKRAEASGCAKKMELPTSIYCTNAPMKRGNDIGSGHALRELAKSADKAKELKKTLQKDHRETQLVGAFAGAW
eukprot:s1736_g7.t1